MGRWIFGHVSGVIDLRMSIHYLIDFNLNSPNSDPFFSQYSVISILI
jgi:hypothetical protein